MKKRIIILSALLCMLFIVNVYAATYTTSRQGSSQGYRVTARAYWVYETGRYSSKGPHTVNSKPSGGSVVYDLEYVLSHVDNDRFGVTQYFRPAYFFPTTGWTYGDSFGIYLQTTGPRSVDF